MEGWAIFWTMLLLPLGLFVLVSMTTPFTMLLHRYLPEGRFKRLLFRKL